MAIIKFLKKNAVFCIAALAAIITCFFVPPSIAYFEYFDLTTLACLFLTLAVICAFRNIKSGRVFDEKFLMTIATIMAFIIGSYTEAVSVMVLAKRLLFNQVEKLELWLFLIKLMILKHLRLLET